ncbi:MAG: maleylpyruvate isomerase family mycothiol-dependent enzyme [Pseudonocardiaceae bacterium]|nr:maleylpyruvate isomerase family mycothiol-dependent enzyme [Pseudonocardiaceae bacterium]
MTPTTELGWAAAGQVRLEDAVAGLPDLAGPSRLPGWTRGHVVTHLARNADALVRLLEWARTGAENPMYASPEARNAEIEAGAGRPHAEQLDDLRRCAARFAETAGRLQPSHWEATVRTAQGRDVPASAIGWMRVREVWLHLVDLDAGADIDVLPDDIAAALVRDVAGWMDSRIEQGVALRLGDDTDAAPVVFGPSGAAPVAVSGPVPELVGWLTGRSPGTRLTAPDGLPELPRWL